MRKKGEEAPVKDPETDEILVPWGTMLDELVELGLINGDEGEINGNG